jgi:hypothetical protein
MNLTDPHARDAAHRRTIDVRFRDALTAALDVVGDRSATLVARGRALEIADCLAEMAADEAIVTRMLAIVEAHADEDVVLPLVGSVRRVLGDRCVRPLARVGARAFEKGQLALLAEVVDQLIRYRPWELEAVPDGWAEAAIVHAIDEGEVLVAGQLVDLWIRWRDVRAPWLHAILRDQPRLLAHSAISPYAVLMLQLVNPTVAGCRRLAREATLPRHANADEWSLTSNGHAALQRAIDEETDREAKQVMIGWRERGTEAESYTFFAQTAAGALRLLCDPHCEWPQPCVAVLASALQVIELTAERREAFLEAARACLGKGAVLCDLLSVVSDLVPEQRSSIFAELARHAAEQNRMTALYDLVTRMLTDGSWERDAPMAHCIAHWATLAANWAIRTGWLENAAALMALWNEAHSRTSPTSTAEARSES